MELGSPHLSVCLSCRPFALNDLDDYEKHFTVMNYDPDVVLKQVGSGGAQVLVIPVRFDPPTVLKSTRVDDGEAGFPPSPRREVSIGVTVGTMR